MKTTTAATSIRTTHRRRPATHSRRCIRFFVRHNGQIVRLLCVNDYRLCETGGEARTFFKRLSHRRYPVGMHLDQGNAAIYAGLPIDTWVELAA